MILDGYIGKSVACLAAREDPKGLESFTEPAA